MKYSINLLPSKESNFTDKVVYFAFHYLRYILVITQLVVICVFFYRFKVDQEIVDLKDTLTQKADIVKATSSLLKEVDTINKQVEAVNSVLTKQNAFQDIYTYFFSVIPSTVYLTTIEIDAKSITCAGVTADSNSVKVFYEKLKNDKKFKTVALKNVNRTEEGYVFTIELDDYIPKTP